MEKPKRYQKPNYRRFLLNETETKIAELILTGATNPEIAKAVNITIASIEVTMFRLYKKIGARNKTHAAAICAQRDVVVNMAERFMGTPMKIFPSRKNQQRKIREHFELW